MYVVRGVYATALFILMCTAWMIVAGTQVISTIGDMARFGSILFQILVPLQLTLILFLSAIQSAASVAQEKDKNTFILLLMTRLGNAELVLGRLFASLLQVMMLIAVSLPILMLTTLFGGVAIEQVLWVAAVTAVSGLAAGSLGSTIALWRDKTFQTLALTIMLLAGWIGGWEAVGWIAAGQTGADASWVSFLSPARAIQAATQPMLGSAWPIELIAFVGVGLLVSALLNAWAIFRVRAWNPGREVRAQQPEFSDDRSAEAGKPSTDAASEASSERLAPMTVKPTQPARPVWNNPVLWREMKTWAYGRKIVFIRLAYWMLSLAVLGATIALTGSDELGRSEVSVTISSLARVIGPYFLASLVLINALAVTSITNERDGKALDLLMVTDLSPKEFLFGKLLGVLYVTRDMVVLPLVVALVAWWFGGFRTPDLIYLTVGLMVMNIFVTMLGIHCGSSYTNSRQAVAVSLGSVFFLFVGVLTCLYMMVSFGSFQGQLTPFLAFIVGGGIGLYVSWGRQNPSPAILLTTGVLPLAMFFVVTSFLLGRTMSVFLVMTATYGFATTAMMMPALGEYMIAMGRVRLQEDE